MSSTWEGLWDALKFYWSWSNLKKFFHSGVPGAKYAGIQSGVLARRRALARKERRLRRRADLLAEEISRIDAYLSPEDNSCETAK